MFVNLVDSLEERPNIRKLPKMGVLGKIKTKLELPNGIIRLVVVGIDRVEVLNYMENDDNAWIWGIIYYNPKDKKNFVETRIGMGLTTNMARGWAKVLTAVGVIAILACLVSCIWVMKLEFSPMVLQQNGTHVQAYHTKVVYDIDLESVKEVELITELPKMSKSSGNSMETQLEGTFYIRDEQKKCKVFCNPQHKVFIRLVTDNNIYYLGGENEAQTTMIYTYLVTK